MVVGDLGLHGQLVLQHVVEESKVDRESATALNPNMVAKGALVRSQTATAATRRTAPLVSNIHLPPMSFSTEATSWLNVGQANSISHLLKAFLLSFCISSIGCKMWHQSWNDFHFQIKPINQISADWWYFNQNFIRIHTIGMLQKSPEDILQYSWHASKLVLPHFVAHLWMNASFLLKTKLRK